MSPTRTPTPDYQDQSGSFAVRTARAALHLLTERGLAPTPEHYASLYHEVSGQKLPIPASLSEAYSPTQKLDNELELLKLIRTLVSSVTESTGDLADNLDSQNRNIRDSINALNLTEEKKDILALLQIVSATALSIQHSVEDTHRELTSARESLDKVRLELEETREQVMLDPLTGARNRFCMDIHLSQEAARVRRHGFKLAVVLLDLDHFKLINDNHGHDAGDQLLIYFVQLSKAVLRESDTVFRYGGEEFLFMLPDTELQGAVFTLDRLKLMLHKSPMHYQGGTIPFTFSAGVAEMQANENIQTLLQRTDRALYAAKAGGRNRTFLATEDQA